VRQAQIKDELDRLYKMAGVSRVDKKYQKYKKKNVRRSDVDRPNSVRQVTKETYPPPYRYAKETYEAASWMLPHLLPGTPAAVLL
jgi:hypothetical protein